MVKCFAQGHKVSRLGFSYEFKSVLWFWVRRDHDINYKPVHQSLRVVIRYFLYSGFFPRTSPLHIRVDGQRTRSWTSPVRTYISSNNVQC